VQRSLHAGAQEFRLRGRTEHAGRRFVHESDGRGGPEQPVQRRRREPEFRCDVGRRSRSCGERVGYPELGERSGELRRRVPTQEREQLLRAFGHGETVLACALT
jgi:hypothetical protein